MTMTPEQAADNTPTDTALFAIGTASPKPRRVIRARRPPRAARSETETPPAPIFRNPPPPGTSTVPKKRSAENDVECDGSEAMMPPLASGDESSQEYNADVHLTDDRSSVDTASEYDADTVNDPPMLPDSSTEVDDLQLMENIVFNVVSPLSIQNRFQSFEDDDDSNESIPALEDNEANAQLEIEPPTTLNRVPSSERQTMRSTSLKGGRTTRPKKDKKKKKKNSNNDNLSDKATCSICMEPDQPDSKWNQLVILPCCGGAISPAFPPKELNFSTRFCAGCILRLVQINADKDGDEYGPWEGVVSEFPYNLFYQDNESMEDGEILECPRCRELLNVHYELSSDCEEEESECDCSDCQMERRRRQLVEVDGVSSISITEASFMEKVEYSGRKRGMAPLLWRMAFLPRNFITTEALGGEEESVSISKLIAWGILKKNGDVFTLKKDDQVELLRLFDIKKNWKSESDEEADFKMSAQFLPCLIVAVFDLIKKMQLIRALRMVNHIGVLFHVKRLPPLPLDVWQGMVVTGLNVFCASIILRLAITLAVNGGLIFGSIFIVCESLRFSARQTSKLAKNAIIACLVAFIGGYYAHKMFAISLLVWNKVTGYVMQ